MEEERNVEGTTAPFGTELEAEGGGGNEREEGSAVDAHSHTPIVWQKREASGEGTPDLLALQREANAKRAQRFGIDFKEPSRDLVFQVKRYKNPFGPASAAVGVDPFSEEEQEKRRQRAQKFGSTLRALQNAEEGQSNDAKEKEQEEENEATEKADHKGDEDEDADDEEEEEVEVEEGMDVVAASEERKDVGDSVARRMDTIHLYGTDDMSTENVFKHFFEYSPSYVEWINDSSCNVVFPDEAAAKRALFSGCNSPLPFSLDEKELYSWKQGKPWRGRPIMLRLATVEDRKPLPHEMAPRHRSRWSASTMRVSSGLGKKTKHRERGEGRSRSTNATTRKERRSRDRKSRKRRGDANETQNTSAKREPPSRAGSISLEGFSKVEMEERNQLRSQRFKRELASVGGGSAFLPSEEVKRKEREEDDEEEVEL